MFIHGESVLIGFRNKIQQVFDNLYDNKINRIFRKCITNGRVDGRLYDYENRDKFKKIVNKIGKKVNNMLAKHEKYIDIKNDIYIRLFNRLYKTLNNVDTNFCDSSVIADQPLMP